MTDTSDILRIAPQGEDEDRFHRQQLIGWWDQELLGRTRVLLIGAGALGNEILKNLALLGIGDVAVVDMDDIEFSNLARAVLFREHDIGRPKAEVACARAVELFPGLRARPLVVNALHDLGLGAFHWADVVVCGLDNREARVAVNRACALLGKPWLEGAIERLDGVSRVFLSDEAACYECTMNEVDWQALEARRSCALLNREEMEAGKTPTTATTSSIVAGFQCQDLLKIVHGLPVDGGTGIVFNGQFNQVYPVEYTRRDDCPSHERIETVTSLSRGHADITAGELLDRAGEDLGEGAVLEFSRELIARLTCANCGAGEAVHRPLGAIGMERAACPECGSPRYPELMHGLDPSWPDPSMTPADLGLPALDIVFARRGDAVAGYVLDGDLDRVLGGISHGRSAR